MVLWRVGVAASGAAAAFEQWDSLLQRVYLCMRLRCCELSLSKGHNLWASLTVLSTAAIAVTCLIHRHTDTLPALQAASWTGSHGQTIGDTCLL